MAETAFTEKADLNEAERINAISMLYDGALKFTKTAKEKTEQGDSAGRVLYIRKTSAIIKELSNALNMEGGDIANNLKRLYIFTLENLKKAEMDDNPQLLEDVIKVIQILSEAWTEIQQASNT